MDGSFVITYIGGYYRYVSHIHKLATTGFKTEGKLIEYKDSIRFDDTTKQAMQLRYFMYY